MEIALPLVALSGLYYITNQSKKRVGGEPVGGVVGLGSTIENFSLANRDVTELPNTNIPNRNYPEEYPIISNEIDQTSSLSNNNRFNGGVYTDKYFNPFVAGNKIQEMQDADAATVEAAGQRYTSLNGNEVSSAYFEHNNMVPFFGSTLRNNHKDGNTNESILDNLNGSGSQYFSKKEQSPMFSPHNNLQWAYGAPNTNDFYQSRVNPSMKMSNVKPFAEERVGPGLGLGYTTEGAGGFNSGMAMRDAWVDRGVDELRVANKPKPGGIVMYGHEGPALSFIQASQNVQTQGAFEKHGPETAFEMGANRLFTTTGIEMAPTLIPVPIKRDVNRPETTTSYVGGAGGIDQTYAKGDYMPSHNNVLSAYPVGVANANGRFYSNTGDYGIQSQTAYANNRTDNSQSTYLGVVGGAIGAVVAPFLDVLKPSRKENTVGNLRPYQNPGTAVTQSYIYNPRDRPAATIRDTTQNSKFHLNVDSAAQQNGRGYITAEHQAIDTNRQITDQASAYIGGSSAREGSRNMKNYIAEYNQKNNDIKASTNVGYMTGGNTNVFNNQINMKTAPRRENEMKNNRDIVPNMPYQSAEIKTMGSVRGTPQLYSGMGLDRNNGDILTQLNGNPYNLSVLGGI